MLNPAVPKVPVPSVPIFAWLFPNSEVCPVFRAGANPVFNPGPSAPGAVLLPNRPVPEVLDPNPPNRLPAVDPNPGALVVVVPKAAGLLLLNKLVPPTPPNGVVFVCPNKLVPVPKAEPALVLVVVPKRPVDWVACVLPKRPMVLV